MICRGLNKRYIRKANGDFSDYLVTRVREIEMPASAAVAKKTSPQRGIAMSNFEGQSLYAAKQSRFTTSKLIQNLGSGNDGAQFQFNGGLRTAHGRDWVTMPGQSPYGWKDLLTDLAIITVIAGIVLSVIGSFPDFFGKFIPILK